MSAKWRALQHRHRYTYNAVVFPSSFSDSLTQFLASPPDDEGSSFSKFWSELKELASLNSTYSQINHAKKLASSFTELLLSSADESLNLKATRVYLEVLFLENSSPLHRTLVSALGKLRKFESLICSCFRELCNEYGGKKRFCVSRVALSVMGMPKLGFLVDVIEDCAVSVAEDVVLGLNSVILEVQELSRPSPIVMEQCQESLSCLYYLLQRFPAKFRDLSDPDCGCGGGELKALEKGFGVMISILKSVVFTRDCFVAAGVAFCAALQVCLSPQELGSFIIEGIFYQTNCNLSNNDCNSEFDDAIGKVPYNGDVCSEIRSFSVLNRLCLIRGILTAVSRDVLNIPFSVSSNNSNFTKNISSSVKTILYNGILPELCDYCESPTDSHFNFHALTVMQICLQQIKTSILANLTYTSDNYDPIPEDMGTRILRIIWNNLEDPLSQTVKQVHLVFDLFLDIESTLRRGEGGERIKSFLQKIASDLLCLGPRCKGRYAPLASLTKRLGTKPMLDMSPNLLFETVQAYIDDDVCTAATSFLKCFLECLRDECWSSDGIEGGYAVYRGHCLPPFLFGLASGTSKLRSNLNTYAVPVILDVDVDGVFPMLAFISVEPSEGNRLSYPKLVCTNMELRVEQQVAVLVSLLKVSRSLALIEGDIDWWKNSAELSTESVLENECNNCYALVCIKGIKFKVVVDWLVLALTHVDESLRVDAAESLFLNPKTATLPSHLELTLMKEAVPLNMRCCSTAFQMKWTSLFRKFFSRVRTALERQFKQGGWQPTVSFRDNDGSCTGTEETVIRRAEDLFNFMRWLSSFLFFSCYPSAPYKRKIMSMELILTMASIWSITPSQEKPGSVSPESCLYPYNKGFTSPDSTLVLVGSIIDSWDRLRESSFRILLHFPNPLPGISSEDMVQKVIAWSKKLVCSPRVRESDAGALTLRLMFRKYVLELGWIVRVSDIVCLPLQPQQVNRDEQVCKSRPPAIEYVKSLIDWLEVAVEEGEKDLSEACKNSFVHGILLALRYTFEELDWNSDAILSGYSEMRLLLEKLLELVMQITSLALWVVSADAWYLPEDMDDMINDDSFLLDVSEEMDGPTQALEDEDKKSKPTEDVRSSGQIVMVGCWLAMKEVSLLLGTIIRKIPLPSNDCSDSVESENRFSNAADVSMTTFSVPMLDLKQLEKIGNHFLEVLLKMKHNGAIDKTRAGFTALCNRLLCSNDPRLTESWMEQLMERTVAKGQVVDDLLRRSAGIPAAFIALFLAEPEGAPKKLLPQALRWLIDVADRSLLDLTETKGLKKESQCLLENSNQQLKSALPSEMNATFKSSKIRDEGVIPTVHAFNIIRAVFNDTNLATDTSGFSAEALIVSIRSFSSPYWEIRNSACLAYTALVRRMIGFLNVQKRESARRGLTGLEFFHRYPSLHSFIFNELKLITELLGDTSLSQSESNLANVVHPSLCPMLILLSRLKPSPLASENGDDLDPFLFMPFIRRCSTQSNLKVRILASRALTGLVSNEKLPVVLQNIASELPYVGDHNTAIPASSSCPTSGTHRANSNLIHGILLQLGSLVDTNCRNLGDFSMKDQILVDLIKVLGRCSWIASPERCPCPIVNASFLRVLDHILCIARTVHISGSFYAVRNLLLELSTECLDVEASYGLSYYDPTIAELREQAAKSYFSCVFQASEEADEVVFQMPQRRSPLNSKLSKIPEMENSFAGLQERLVHSLSDSSYEVRLATLKWLLKFLESRKSDREVSDLLGSELRNIHNWIKSNLQDTLMSRLELDKSHRCTNYILRNLFTWNILLFQKPSDEVTAETIYVGGMDCDSVFQLWDRLISLYELTRHTKTKETLIRCLAICIRRFADAYTNSVLDLEKKKTMEFTESDHLERSARLYACITAFVDMIREHSAPSEPVNMRRAAAESIAASGLLEQAEFVGSYVVNHQIPPETLGMHFEQQEAINMYARQVLALWFACIKLLEDEDDGIRQRLAVDVQKCCNSERHRNSSHAREAPIQVEKVIESSFEYLSSIFGCWIEFSESLLRWVHNAASQVVSEGDLVRRVFDKEIDNHHEEKLLISQICCSQLEKIPISKSWTVDTSNKDQIKNYLRRWRKKFSHQLMSFAKDQSSRMGGIYWIGGFGNHKDSFLPVYSNLLGFYALSSCIFNGEIEDGMSLLSDVIELGKVISPFIRNPLVHNLYLLVVKLHERKIGALAEQTVKFTDDMIWEAFDPYFLLR
ncbi:thyroid adenoma-associated protein homolog isoform X2 [Mangifera indica]|uniref:thyroid adenoma-associated protein homolog isoform X2 n=1 Tax=Mangifera indica TaxID=29780 RepID=UPI001CFB5C6F|nr:thyroid adenoma-associated protein homolog isoform X2 [Mangifera indica]